MRVTVRRHQVFNNTIPILGELRGVGFFVLETNVGEVYVASSLRLNLLRVLWPRSVPDVLEVRRVRKARVEDLVSLAERLGFRFFDRSVTAMVNSVRGRRASVWVVPPLEEGKYPVVWKGGVGVLHVFRYPKGTQYHLLLKAGQLPSGGTVELHPLRGLMLSVVMLRIRNPPTLEEVRAWLREWRFWEYSGSGPCGEKPEYKIGSWVGEYYAVVWVRRASGTSSSVMLVRLSPSDALCILALENRVVAKHLDPSSVRTALSTGALETLATMLARSLSYRGAPRYLWSLARRLAKEMIGHSENLTRILSSPTPLSCYSARTDCEWGEVALDLSGLRGVVTTVTSSGVVVSELSEDDVCVLFPPSGVRCLRLLSEKCRGVSLELIRELASKLAQNLPDVWRLLPEGKVPIPKIVIATGEEWWKLQLEVYGRISLLRLMFFNDTVLLGVVSTRRMRELAERGDVDALASLFFRVLEPEVRRSLVERVRYLSRALAWISLGTVHSI